MFRMRCFLPFFLFLAVQISLNAQTHISVPLGDPVYYVIEQAQMRGLCAFLPGVKPYSREKVLSIIGEILDNSEMRRFGGLSQSERGILEQFRREYGSRETGLDLKRGTYSAEHLWDESYFSGEFGFGLDLEYAGGYFTKAGGYREAGPIGENLFSGAVHPDTGDYFHALDSQLYVYFIGDLGKSASYGFGIGGRVFQSPRAILGTYYPYYDGFTDPDYPNINAPITTFSQPHGYFPFTFKRKWDGSLWAANDVSNAGHLAWPQGISIGYSMVPEFAGTLLNGHVFLRAARMDREWAGMSGNSSLVLNQSAQPFLALETVIVPFPWIAFSSLTGVLEFYNATGANNSGGIKSSAEVSQNVLSIVMVEFNIKNFLHLDIGSTAIWPKRFELGYLFPMADNFLYQNNIGDFDNMALFLNIQGQYPGLGKLWFSFFLDEANPERDFFELDRMMYAYQAGGSIYLPWLPLPFTSLTFSYTKNEPYNYTHNREILPWYGDTLMETNYVNGGASLGHYIPPNSDEILVRLESIPVARSLFRVQYQMIRHGADYGDRAVDGSSLWSELDPHGRSEKSVLRKYFLRDGAYQWMHIFKLGGEYSLTGFQVPVKVYCEAGGVYSFFTDIDRSIAPNSGSPNPYSVVNDDSRYPHSMRLIAVLGVHIFPK